MKKFNHFFVLGLFIILVAFQSDNVGSFEVNTEHSTVRWTGYKIGSKHEGELKLKEGGLDMVEGVLKGGKFVVDMATLSCTDIKDADNNKKLVDHLKSGDFFNVEAHPTASFTINKTIPYGSEKVKGNGQEYTKDTYKVLGDLTIKGITKPIKTKIDIYDYESSISGVARLEIDRSDFDIRYGSGSFFDDLGDKLIYDEIRLDIQVSARSATK